MAARKTLTIEIPEKKRASSKIASFSMSSDGRGKLIGVDGTPKAKFIIEQHVSKPCSFIFERVGGEPIVTKYKVSRHAGSGAVTVSGKLNGAPFTVAATKYGELIEGSQPPHLKAADKKLFSAMMSAFEERARAHFDRAGCALAGLEIIVSAFTLHPIGLAFGFVGMLIAC